MRDIIVAAVIFGSLPFILRRPYIGILMWSWVSYMSPHRLSWGFAYDFPFAQVIAIVTILALLFSKEEKSIPVTPLTMVLLAFGLWMVVTTAAAIYPDAAFVQLKKVLKILFVTFLTLVAMRTKERLNLLLWVIVVSIGFYGIKGGVFTLMTGGGERVYGPSGSFIEDNNALALAILMCIPLMSYLRAQSADFRVRTGLLGAMVLGGASALGSQSRGAVVAGITLVACLWLNSGKKIFSAVALVILVVPLVLFMPANWQQRIATMTGDTSADVTDIEAMHQRFGEGTISAPIPSRDWLGYWPKDFSALGRVNAWNYAINVANDRITGAGFDSWTWETFQKYAPIVEEVQAAHSIFFGVLGDHGWLGLLLFLALYALAWRNAGWVISRTAKDPEMKWAGDMLRMVRVSFLVYFAGGSFLSLSYFDLPWHLIAVVALCQSLTVKHLASAAAGAKPATGVRPTAATLKPNRVP